MFAKHEGANQLYEQTKKFRTKQTKKTKQKFFEDKIVSRFSW